MKEEKPESERPSGKENDTIIVFNAVEKTMYTAKKSELSIKPASIIPAPRWSSHIKLYEKGVDTSRMIAGLNLTKLGRLVTLKRRAGLLTEIYVLHLQASTEPE